MKTDRLNLPAHLKQPKNKQKTDKIYEIFFKTLDIRHKRQ